MTRITFLIGNGFDVNVGLDTRYSDFYQYYTKNNPDDMLAKAIEEKYVDWSDLELGLGRYTEQVKEEDEDAFWRSEENLEQELMYFLENQMKRVNIGDGERKRQTANEMKRSLTEFYKEMPVAIRNHISNLIVEEDIVYSFITFNYTDTLDRCVDATKSIMISGVERRYVGTSVCCVSTLGEVLHIHGTTNKELVLGVNDEDQIANKSFNAEPINKQCLIKEETNKSYRNGKIEEAREIIDESVIICLFGLSLGSTDKMWWRYICEWLQEDRERRLIIYTRVAAEEGRREAGRRKKFVGQKNMRNRFRANAEISDEEWDELSEQIYVECNAELFKFEIVDK